MTKKQNVLSRRNLVIGTACLTGLAVSACSTNSVIGNPPVPKIGRNNALMYAPLPNERFPLPAADIDKVPAKYYRRQVDYPTAEPVGTVIVDTGEFYLYLVQEGGKAMRYGVGLGRAGFAWSGRARIGGRGR